MIQRNLIQWKHKQTSFCDLCVEAGRIIFLKQMMIMSVFFPALFRPTWLCGSSNLNKMLQRQKSTVCSSFPPHATFTAYLLLSDRLSPLHWPKTQTPCCPNTLREQKTEGWQNEKGVKRTSNNTKDMFVICFFLQHHHVCYTRKYTDSRKQESWDREHK